MSYCEKCQRGRPHRHDEQVDPDLLVAWYPEIAFDDPDDEDDEDDE